MPDPSTLPAQPARSLTASLLHLENDEVLVLILRPSDLVSSDESIGSVRPSAGRGHNESEGVFAARVD